MDQRINDATINRPEGHRPIDAPYIHINIETQISQLKSEKAWHTNDRNSITLFKSGSLRMVLVAMHPEAAMHTMKPENVLAVQLLQGKMELRLEDKCIALNKNEILTLHEGIDYNLVAMEESVFILTVSES